MKKIYNAPLVTVNVFGAMSVLMTSTVLNDDPISGYSPESPVVSD